MTLLDDKVMEIFDKVGAFLTEHRLGADPVNYEFAYRVVTTPDGPVAAAVRAMTEGGIRLTRKDIVALGGEAARPEPEVQNRVLHDTLVARTQLQVESFADLVKSVRAETTDFGRDLLASSEAIRQIDGSVATEVVKITGAMVDRVRATEDRLEAATREAAELRHQLEEARDDARRDPLTGLANRRVFEEGFATNLASGIRQCVAICDIDRFKLVNDNFGHAVGDRVLKAIGEVLSAQCRDHIVARYGGEEFALLFTGISADEARALIEEARETVANKRYRLRETDAPLGAVTFSAGLTCAAAGEQLDTAFERADQLLYPAKTNGRNQIMHD